MYDIDWVKAEKVVDENYDGSIWEELEYDRELCPTCNSHLHNGICLNTCHLSSSSRKRFNAFMRMLQK